MKSKSFIFGIVILLVMIAIFTLGSVYGSWDYSGNRINDINHSFNFAINNYHYNWDGSDILPREEASNHMYVLDAIINGDKGINVSTSQLNTNLKNRLDATFIGWGKRDNYGSADPNNNCVPDLLGDEKNVTFIIQAVEGIDNPNYTKMYIYTTDINLGEKGASAGSVFPYNTKPGKPSIAIGEWIYPIYRTELVRENAKSKWVAINTVVGKAKSAWYTESRELTSDITQIPSFDIYSWVNIKMGDNLENAIWSFAGDSRVVEANSTCYYKIKPNKAEVLISIENQTSSIIVRNDNHKVIAEGMISDGMVIVSFSSLNNLIYYIEVSTQEKISVNIGKQ